MYVPNREKPLLKLSLTTGCYSCLPPPSFTPPEGALFIWNPNMIYMSQKTRFLLQFCNWQLRRSSHHKLQIPRAMNVSKNLPMKLNITNTTIIAIDIVVVTEESFSEHQKLAEKNHKRREREKRKWDERKAAGNSQKKGKGKQKPCDSGIDISEDEDMNCEAAPSTKKQKLAEPSTKKITAYIHIQAPTPHQPTLSRSKGKKDLLPTQVKGPCFFTTNHTYGQFKNIVAKALPCKLKLFPAERMYWKYEKPINDPKKPLPNINSYKAMVLSLKDHKANCVITIFMPPPAIDDVVSNFCMHWQF